MEFSGVRRCLYKGSLTGDIRSVCSYSINPAYIFNTIRYFQTSTELFNTR